jgi:hypothetical protein
MTHRVKAVRYRPVVKFCLTLDVVDTISDLYLLLDGAAILDFAPVFDGYAYTYYRFRTTSQKRIRQYIIYSYSLRHPTSQAKYRPVKLQGWYAPPSNRA